jgi:hypothetical protein
MADASRQSPVPPDWNAAFAALPLEAPAANHWPALAAKIERNMPRARRRVRWALAAALIALAALPVAWRQLDTRTDTLTPHVAVAPTVASTNAPPQITDAAAVNADAGASMGAATASIDSSAIAAAIDPSMRKTAGISSRNHRQLRAPTSLPAPPGIATTSTAVDIGNRADPSRGHDPVSLESLYAASAQLETLLSVTRDLRVESGPAAALASTLDAELARIDAQLAQPGLEALQEQALWQARVETLQASAGFESHLRLLAADGGQLDGMLVSVD